MAALLSDLRLSFRRLVRHPGYALGLIATLALGIGVCAAMYSVVHGVVIKGLDYPEADRLVELNSVNTEAGGELAALSAAEAESLGRIGAGLQSSGYYLWGGATYLGGQQPRMLTVIQVGGEFFRTLGVQPQLGRWLTAEDQGGVGRVVLSHGLWMELFGGDPGVIGKPFKMDWITADIVGVMPPSFGYPTQAVGLWIAFDPAEINQDPEKYKKIRYMYAVGRMQPSATDATLRRDLDQHSERLAAEYGSDLRSSRLRAVGMLDEMTGEVRPVLLALLLVAGLALLVACANVSNLVALRGVSRMHELGIHQALGASSARLARLVFTETVLLGLVATVLGVLLAKMALQYFIGIDESGVPRASEVTLDMPAIAVSALIGVLASRASAAIPAVRLRRADIAGCLRSGDSRLAGQFSIGRVSRWLPVAAGAFSVGGLAAALLLTSSLWQLERVALGYSPDEVLALNVFRRPDAKSPAFARDVVARMMSLPGVEAASVSSSTPMSGIGAIPVEVTVADRPGLEPLRPNVRSVEGPIQRVLGLTLLQGRWFDSGDHESSEPVAIVNQAFVDRVFLGGNVIGHYVSLPPFSFTREAKTFRIVGVMADARLASVDQAPESELWVPFAQYPVNSTAVMLRAKGDPAQLIKPAEDVLFDLQPDQAIYRTERLADVVARAMAMPRFFARNAGAFALLALLLAAIGVHSVVAFQMAQRRREFALRLALGSAPHGLAARVLRYGYALGLPAAGVGLLLGLGFGQLLRSAVFGIEDAIWVTAAVSALLMLVIVALACLRSMRQAMRVEPMAVLRGE